MFNQPTRAKRLFFDVIPRAMDEYLANLDKAVETQDDTILRANPAWFIHGGVLDKGLSSPVSFSALLNLASVANAESSETLWKFLRRYDPTLSPETHPYVDRLVGHALVYFKEFVRPAKTFRAPTDLERVALQDLADALKQADPSLSPVEVQDIVFEIGKKHQIQPLRAWFGCLYEVLLGQTEGPRFGIFASLFGLPETVGLIEESLARKTSDEGTEI